MTTGKIVRKFDKVMRPGMCIKPVLFDARVALGLAVLREVNDMDDRPYRVRIKIEIDVLVHPRDALVGERVDEIELFKLPGISCAVQVVDVPEAVYGAKRTYTLIDEGFWMRTA